jgi:hypothetical protein
MVIAYLQYKKSYARLLLGRNVQSTVDDNFIAFLDLLYKALVFEGYKSTIRKQRNNILRDRYKYFSTAESVKEYKTPGYFGTPIGSSKVSVKLFELGKLLDSINNILQANEYDYPIIPGIIAGGSSTMPTIEIPNQGIMGGTHPPTSAEWIQLYKEIQAKEKGGKTVAEYIPSEEIERRTKGSGAAISSSTSQLPSLSSPLTRYEQHRQTLARLTGVAGQQRTNVGLVGEALGTYVKTSELPQALAANVRSGVEGVQKGLASVGLAKAVPAPPTATATATATTMALLPPGRSPTLRVPLNNMALRQKKQEEAAAEALRSLSKVPTKSSVPVSMGASTLSVEEQVLGKIKRKTSLPDEIDLLRTLISAVLNVTSLRDPNGLAVVLMSMVDGAYTAKDNKEPPMKTRYFEDEGIKAAYLDLHAFYANLSKGGARNSRNHKNKTQKRKQSRKSCWPKSRKQNKTRKH